MRNTLTIYGISNCDTVKKARAWLAERKIDHVFHDFRKQGVPDDRLDRWISALGWESLVNRKGTTWRKLEGHLRDSVVDASTAKSLMVREASVIKRPVVEWDNAITVGFDPVAWEQKRQERV
jgi:arsenate reductase